MKKRLLSWGVIWAVCMLASLPALSADESVEARSREYKLPLDPARFSPDGLQANAQALQQMLEKTAQTAGARTSGSLGDIEVLQVRYWDVPQTCDLRKQNLIFRERQNRKGDRQLTLKLRAEDSTVALNTPVEVVGPQQPKYKLEEDVTPPMQVWLSRSVTIKLKADSAMDTSKAAAFFPQIKNLSGKLVQVNRLVMLQTDMDLPTLHWPKLKAKSSLTLWAEKPGAPFVAAELSFRIDMPTGEDASNVLQGPQQLYVALQQSDWRDKKADSTKSAFIYQVDDKSFCQKN